MAGADSEHEAALARLAVERGLLDPGTARGALERATRQRTTLLEALRAGGRLDARLERELRAIADRLAGRRTASSRLVASDSLGPTAASVPPPAPPARRRLGPGDRIAGHTIESILGSGAMGAVFLGRSDAGARHAIKVPFLAPGDLLDRARFEREAQSLARLKPHRHVVRVHSAGLEGDSLYCVLELVEGESLDKAVKRGIVPWPRALEIAEQLAQGLAHVHAAGIFHRDVKPANVLVRAEDGTAVLSDFGLARDETRERLTQTGVMVGTPVYMPPEQVNNARPADARSDVYALGATLYHLLTGRVPLPAASIDELLRKLAHERPAPPSELTQGIPPAVDAVVLRALEKAPEDRYPSAEAFAADLALARGGEAVSARRAGHGRQLARDVARDPRRAIKSLLLVACVLALANLALVTRRALREPAAEAPSTAPGGRGPLAEKRHAAWRRMVDAAVEALEPPRRALDAARLGSFHARPAAAATPEGERVAAVATQALLVAFARLETALAAQAPSPEQGEVARGELAPTRGAVLAELAVVEVHAALEGGDAQGAEALLRRALEGRIAPERTAAELALAGVRVGLVRRSPELLRGLPRAAALRRLALAPIDDVATVGPAALALLDPLEKRVFAAAANSPEARRAIARLRARAWGSHEPAELKAQRRAVVQFLEHVLTVDPGSVAEDSVELLEAASAGAGAEVEEVFLELKPESRLAIVRELAALDARDPDALGGIDLAPSLTSTFVRLARDAFEAREADAAGRMVALAIRVSPAAPVDSDLLWSELQRILHDAIEHREWDAAITHAIGAVRAGYMLSWPVSEQPPDLDARLRRLLAGRRDWAVALLLARILEQRATRAAGGTDRPGENEAIELARGVAEDARAPVIVRSRAWELVGDAHAQLVQPAESAAAYGRAHACSPFPGIIAQHVSAELLDAWVVSRRADEQALAAAIEWGRRAVEECQAVAEASRAGGPLPLSTGGVPAYRLTPSEDDEAPYETAQIPLVDALLAAGRLDEAQTALDRPPPRWSHSELILALARVRLLLGRHDTNGAAALLEETLARRSPEARADVLVRLTRAAVRADGWGWKDAAIWLRAEVERRKS